MVFVKKLKKKIPAILLSGLAVVGAFSFAGRKPQPKNANDASSLKKEVIVPRVKNPIVNVFYRTDTILKRTPVLLYNNKGNIFRHYKAGDELYQMRLYLFTHEAWHTHNINTGFRDKYKLSPNQYRKLLSHDEISANLVSLNTMILEYMLSNDKEEYLKKFTPNGFYSFYFKEVAKGNIDPFSTDSAMIEKDMSLRINGIMKTWMERSYDSYSSRQKPMFFNYIRRFGLYEPHDANYQALLHKMYNIGGIDFWKYAEKDISVKDVDLFENLTAVKSFSKRNSAALEEIKKFAPLLENIVDNKQRIAAIQHLIISSEIKAKIMANNYAIDEKITTILYNKTRTKYMQDKDFASFADRTSLLTGSAKLYQNEQKISLNDFIHKVYMLDDVDLSKKINNFRRSNLPYKPDNIHFNYEADNSDIIVWNDMNEMMAATIQIPDNNAVAPKTTPKSQVPEVKPRRSAIQSVELPNFEEPILVNLNTKQIEMLRRLYQNFANIVKLEKTNDERNQKSGGKQQDKIRKIRSSKWKSRKNR